jgi:hypothetical protein
MASGSGVCDVLQLPHFRAPNDVGRYTTKELLDITAQYATNEETAGPLLVPGSREANPSCCRMAPSSIVVQGTKKDEKGSKKKQKWHLKWVAAVAADRPL